MRDGWRRVALGEILKLRSERNHSVCTLLSVTADRGVIPQSESGRRDSSSQDKSLYWDVQSGDIVYNTMRMWQGVSGVAAEAGIVSPAYTVCRPVVDVEKRFIGYLLREPSLVAQFLNRSQGLVSDTWNLRYNDFKEIEIVLPSLSQQRRIADILDEANLQLERAVGYREKLRVVAAAESAEALNVVSSGPGVEWGVLGQVAEISAGVTLGGGESGSGLESSIPYLRVANVQDGFIDTKDLKLVSVRASDIERYRLQAGDVLLTEGGDLDKLGRGGVWEGQVDPCLHQNHVFRVRCSPDKISPYFLARHLASPIGKKYFLGVAKQTTNLASINSVQVKNAPVPLVSLGTQERVLTSIAEWDRRLSVSEREILKLATLKQGLMGRLIGDLTKA